MSRHFFRFMNADGTPATTLTPRARRDPAGAAQVLTVTNHGEGLYSCVAAEQTDIPTSLILVEPNGGGTATGVTPAVGVASARFETKWSVFTPSATDTATLKTISAVTVNTRIGGSDLGGGYGGQPAMGMYPSSNPYAAYFTRNTAIESQSRYAFIPVPTPVGGAPIHSWPSFHEYIEAVIPQPPYNASYGQDWWVDGGRIWSRFMRLNGAPATGLTFTYPLSVTGSNGFRSWPTVTEHGAGLYSWPYDEDDVSAGWGLVVAVNGNDDTIRPQRFCASIGPYIWIFGAPLAGGFPDSIFPASVEMSVWKDLDGNDVLPKPTFSAGGSIFTDASYSVVKFALSEEDRSLGRTWAVTSTFEDPFKYHLSPNSGIVPALTEPLSPTIGFTNFSIAGTGGVATLNIADIDFASGRAGSGTLILVAKLATRWETIYAGPIAYSSAGFAEGYETSTIVMNPPFPGAYAISIRRTAGWPEEVAIYARHVTGMGGAQSLENSYFITDPVVEQPVGSDDDTVSPLIYSAIAPKRTQLRVTFSEPVLMTTGASGALNLANYTIPGLALSSVTRLDDKTVLLTTAPQLPRVTYTLSVANVQDLSGNAIEIE